MKKSSASCLPTAMLNMSGSVHIAAMTVRSNGSDGKEHDFYAWAQGEPSMTDSYDSAAENYIMLVKADRRHMAL